MTSTRKKLIKIGLDKWLYQTLKYDAKIKKISVGKLLRIISKEYYSKPENQV